MERTRCSRWLRLAAAPRLEARRGRAQAHQPRRARGRPAGDRSPVRTGSASHREGAQTRRTEGVAGARHRSTPVAEGVRQATGVLFQHLERDVRSRRQQFASARSSTCRHRAARQRQRQLLSDPCSFQASYPRDTVRGREWPRNLSHQLRAESPSTVRPRPYSVSRWSTRGFRCSAMS